MVHGVAGRYYELARQRRLERACGARADRAGNERLAARRWLARSLTYRLCYGPTAGDGRDCGHARRLIEDGLSDQAGGR